MIYLGILFKKEEENKILDLSKVGLSNASNTFQWDILSGLNKFKEIEIINVLPVGTYPKHYKKLVLQTNIWSYHNDNKNIEIGSINLPFFKQFFRSIRVRKELLKKINNNNNIRNVIVYSTYLPFLKAVYKLDSKIDITLIVTDLPEYYDLFATGIIKKVFRNINNHFIYKYMKRVDSFVLLTEDMKNPLKVEKRPYLLMEGLINSDNYVDFLDTSKNGSSNKKIILYTGTLHYKFGIKILLEAFHGITIENYELWLCGKGDAEKDIIKRSELDRRIKYFGFLPKENIIRLQKEATVLINPRQNNDQFTKYSFPSKTMEYLAIGKPVIMYKLDGIPIEYDKYLNYIEGDTAEEMKDKIIEICELTTTERNEIGKLGQEYVISNKNSTVQAKRLLNFLNHFWNKY